MSYILEPEVAGELGEKTIIDTSIHPPIVKYLHFIFYGWLGDDIIECFPIYLISERLKLKLDEINLTGYQINSCEIEVSEEFKLLQPNVILPAFYWFKVKGINNDDFIVFKNRLKISELAYAILKSFNIKNAIIKTSN